MDRQTLQFNRRRRIDRAVLTLKGIISGVTIDGELNQKEVQEVRDWVDENRSLLVVSPLQEVSTQMETCLKTGVLSAEEREELLWVCSNLDPESDVSDAITQDIQVLHGILHGVLADGIVTEKEAIGLREWLVSNESLEGTYPYDELYVIVREVLKDGVVDEAEKNLLASFFKDFINLSISSRIKSEAERVKVGVKKEYSVPGICATSPQIVFPDSVFTFTGEFRRCIRKDAEAQAIRLGGLVSSNVLPKTNYLVIGAAGNPCWMYACYGRKVEKAVSMRKEGHAILLVHENDFWDAVEDYGIE
jgi:NAD-dependent DNA ligase